MIFATMCSFSQLLRPVLELRVDGDDDSNNNIMGESSAGVEEIAAANETCIL